jgi:hypothetical protein
LWLAEPNLDILESTDENVPFRHWSPEML